MHRDLISNRKGGKIVDFEGFNVKVEECPADSIRLLAERIENNTAFIIGGTGLTRKQRKKLEKTAIRQLKNKQGPIEYHFIQIGDSCFEVIE